MRLIRYITSPFSEPRTAEVGWPSMPSKPFSITPTLSRWERGRPRPRGRLAVHSGFASKRPSLLHCLAGMGHGEKRLRAIDEPGHRIEWKGLLSLALSSRGGEGERLAGSFGFRVSTRARKLIGDLDEPGNCGADFLICCIAGFLAGRTWRRAWAWDKPNIPQVRKPATQQTWKSALRIEQVSGPWTQRLARPSWELSINLGLLKKVYPLTYA